MTCGKTMIRFTPLALVVIDFFNRQYVLLLMAQLSENDFGAF